MRSVLRHFSAILLLAALHWVLLYATAFLLMVGRMGTMHSDAFDPKMAHQLATQRAAMKPYADASRRVIDCVFSMFSWPGCMVQPINSVISEPEKYNPTKLASIATSIFWGSLLPFAFCLINRRIRRHSNQLKVRLPSQR